MGSLHKGIEPLSLPLQGSVLTTRLMENLNFQKIIGIKETYIFYKLI